MCEPERKWIIQKSLSRRKFPAAQSAEQTFSKIFALLFLHLWILYKIHNGTVNYYNTIRLIGYSTPYSIHIFIIQTVVCTRFSRHESALCSCTWEAALTEPKEMIKWNVKSILCGLLLITLYWDWHYISHICRMLWIQRGSKTSNFIIPSK